MTGKPITLTRTSGKSGTFPDFPPRDDMQNYLYLYQPALASALNIHFSDTEGVTVMCETPVGPSVNIRGDIRIPDLQVTFDSDTELVVAQRGHSIESHGKPPDFVLEVASVSTGVIDYTAKRSDYERYGVKEYWRFDPTGGDYHDAALAGDRLVDGRYERIEIERPDNGGYRGYSEVLGLHLCWEEGILRFYDPDAGRYLRTHAEDVARADEAEARANEEAARANEAEAELLRLRERLEELGGV